MAHVMSLIFFPMSIGLMSHVDFKKRQCRPVEFKGQGPQAWEVAGPGGIPYKTDRAMLVLGGGGGGGGGTDSFRLGPRGAALPPTYPDV